MSGFNGDGTFSFTYSWTNDAANGIPITAPRMDTQFADAANGFDNCVTRDGQSPALADLPMGGFKLTGLGNGTATTDAAAYGQLRGGLGTLTGFIGGLNLSTAGSSGTFGIAVGSATDSTSVQVLTLGTAFTKTTGSFTAGSTNGALDTGSIANSTWYHVFIIGSPALASDILISTSATAPTLPGGYTLFRYIGSMKTDASAHWVKFTQRGDRFIWAAGNGTDINANITATQIAVAMNVPTGVNVVANIRGFFQGASSTNSLFLVSSTFESSVTATSGVGVATAQVATEITSGSGVQFTVDVLTDTSGQVNMVASNNSGSNLVRAGAYGWIDRRGAQ